MGSCDFTDGVWIWPEGLAHYVEKHDVILPDDFVQHAARQQWKVPANLDLKSLGDPDPEYTVWILWSRYAGKGF